MMNQAILEAIASRIKTAADLYGPIASTHEALGVAYEELAELMLAIHANDCGEVRREACDLAAIAIRLAEACASPSAEFAARSGFTTGATP